MIIRLKQWTPVCSVLTICRLWSYSLDLVDTAPRRFISFHRHLLKRILIILPILLFILVLTQLDFLHWSFRLQLQRSSRILTSILVLLINHYLPHSFLDFGLCFVHDFALLLLKSFVGGKHSIETIDVFRVAVWVRHLILLTVNNSNYILINYMIIFRKNYSKLNLIFEYF